MRLITDKGEGVDLVACDVLVPAHFVVYVLGQELTARIEYIALIAEDVRKGRAGSIVAQLTLTSSIHRIITELYSFLKPWKTRLQITLCNQNIEIKQI